MADESCGPAKPEAPSAPAKPGQRMVHCVKFDKDMPGLERVPWKGELGKRVYENVSAEAWKLWIEYSKMLVNEYRLNPLDPQSVKPLNRVITLSLKRKVTNTLEAAELSDLDRPTTASKRSCGNPKLRCRPWWTLRVGASSGFTKAPRLQ